MRILLIEDDLNLIDAIRNLLEPTYILESATTGKKALYLAQNFSYDLILLDLQLPDAHGSSLSRIFRANKINCPILALTAEASNSSKITTLDAGADDYLTKPFNSGELTARIRALLRRQSESATVNRLELSDLIIDFSSRLAVRQQTILKLRRREFDLLEYMVRNANKTLRRETLLHHVWPDDSNSYSNLVDAHIKTLRDKIDRPFSKKLIQTIYGVGYRLQG